MEHTIKLHDRHFRVMIPAAEIDKAVAAVAARINEDYKDKETPLFVGVLNGSFMCMSDLIKKIEFNSELSFVKLASYEGTATTGDVKCLIGLNNSLEGRHVIIVEDIVDTGVSIERMVRDLDRLRRPASRSARSSSSPTPTASRSPSSTRRWRSATSSSWDTDWITTSWAAI